ncbi:MAG: flap endonuclease [Gammaproteobacteria bacterium]|nr:flap endonuclease [Gammaproteobacteria bacterium]
MHLFLVDSSIFIFRAWYGSECERVNLEQQPNQAFTGFTDFVYRLLTEQAPRQLVFAFDESRSSSARKSIYADYKANRSPAPRDLKRQFAWCRQWLEALGISCVSSSQWEADDLIGSLRRYHASAQLPAVILTADKDLAQLIGEHDLWWSYLDNIRLDYRAVCRKFGVRPQQIAEQLALTGDKVDNIPGIPEIGRKTAARLLGKYDTLENLRNHLDEVGTMKFRYAASVQRSLIEHQALLDIGLQLTRINCEIEEMRQVEVTRRAAQADVLEVMMREQVFEAPRLERWRSYLAGPLS